MVLIAADAVGMVARGFPMGGVLQQHSDAAGAAWHQWLATKGAMHGA